MGPSNNNSDWDELTKFISTFYVGRHMPNKKTTDEEEEDMLGKSGMNWKELN